MRRTVIALLAAMSVAGCTSATYRGEADGDADGDIDEELPRCSAPVDCGELGFEVAFDFDVLAEVVTVEADRVVLLGLDGVAQDFHTCGLDVRAIYASGDLVRMAHQRIDEPDPCRLSSIQGEPGWIFATECSGEDLVQPSIPMVGWEVSFEPACQGFIDHVCFPSTDPVHLDVPEVVSDLLATTPEGASGRVGLAEITEVGSWQIRLIDARAAEAMSQGRCEAPATGRTALIAAGGEGSPACSDPPDFERHRLGFPEVSADRLEMEMTVVEVTERSVLLAMDDGSTAEYGWFGPDPSEVLEPGQRVVARRFNRDVTGGGFLDVLEVDGEARLAAIVSDSISLELPDLSVIGVTMELGEPCISVQGENACTGEILSVQRYPVHLFYEGSNVAVAVVGDTVEAGPYRATLLEAAQFPGVHCPDGPSTDPWGPFGLTLIR